MSRDDLTSPVAAAATSQVKLCPYNEEEPDIWFRLIEAQFAAAGIKSQKLKYANALASLPKQVLRDILDTIDVCNISDEPFDFLKNTLLGQFGKSKWQSYFELLRLPMEMQGLKPSVLMGKLKQNLPPDELSVDTIVKNFSKTLHVSAPSLPRHNSSTELPSELPAELHSAPLVWVRRGGLVPAALRQPLCGPTRSCAAVPAPSPSESGRGTRCCRQPP